MIRLVLGSRGSRHAATPPDTTAEREVLLAEYTELKQEQRIRIATRDGLIYATLAALFGVATITFTSHRVACVLLAPQRASCSGGPTSLTTSRYQRSAPICATSSRPEAFLESVLVILLALRIAARQRPR